MIGVLIVGCGRIAEKHLEAVGLNEDISLFGLCDTSQDAINIRCAEIKSEKYGMKLKESSINTYKCLSTALSDLKKSNISKKIAVICTPSGIHAEQAITCLDMEINVLCEKPMALNILDAQAMLAASNASESNLFIVKQNRYNPTISLAKTLVEEGFLGDLTMISSNVFWQRPQSYYDSAEWRGTWKYDGGAMLNQASHYFDLLYWLGGPVHSVYALTGTLGRDIEVEDTATVCLKWQNGAIGSINVTTLAYPKNLEGSITLLGSKGSMRIGGQALNKIELLELSETPDYLAKAEDYNYNIDSVYGGGHKLVYRYLHDFYSNGDTSNIVFGEEGMMSLYLILGSYKSSQVNRAIKINSSMDDL